MWQKLSKVYPTQLEAIPLLLLLWHYYLVVSSYHLLPDRIPTHFNIHGVADRWGSRSEVFVLLGVAAFLYVVLTAIGALIAGARDPRRYINLPVSRKAALTGEQVEKLRVLLARSLFALKLLIQGLFVYIAYITIEVAFNRASGRPELPLFLLTAAVLGVAGYMAWMSFRITSSQGGSQG